VRAVSGSNEWFGIRTKGVPSDSWSRHAISFRMILERDVVLRRRQFSLFESSVQLADNREALACGLGPADHVLRLDSSGMLFPFHKMPANRGHSPQLIRASCQHAL